VERRIRAWSLKAVLFSTVQKGDQFSNRASCRVLVESGSEFKRSVKKPPDGASLKSACDTWMGVEVVD